MIIGVPDKKLSNWLKDKEYMIATDEGEAIGIAVGEYLVKGMPSMVFMSADGFCNALNAITSLIIPYKIPIQFVISSGRQEPQHIIMTEQIGRIIYNLNLYDNRTSYQEIT